MSGAISYQNGIIQIMDGTGDVLNAIRGISCLDVDNRFSTSAQHYFQSSIAVNFNGYGELQNYCIAQLTVYELLVNVQLL